MRAESDAGVAVAALRVGVGSGATLTCRLSSRRSTPGSAGHDLLDALGRDLLLPRRAKDALPTAIAWLVANHVDTVIIEFGELMEPAVWEQLLVPLQAAGIACCWVLTPAVTPAHRRAWDGHGTTAIGDQQLCDLRQRGWRPAASTQRAAHEDFPRVADSDFPTFLADCRRQLAPPDFARVCEEHELGAARMRTLATQRRGGIDHGSVYEELRELVVDQHADVATCRLRGAAMACFLESDHLLHVDLDVFFANAGALVSPFDSGTQARLGRIACTQTAAVGTLCTSLRTTLSDLRGLCVGDVEDGTTLRLRDSNREIPIHARVALRAHLLTRRAAGARDLDPLFVTAEGTRKQRFDGDASRLADAVGIRVALSEAGRERAGARGETASTWARRTGIALKPLERRRRRA